MTEEQHHEPPGGPRDRGTSFIELLVSIVLLGTIVVATLTGLRASIVGSEVDEDSARAHAWLQAAVDEVYATGYLPCDANTNAAIVAAYQAAADSATRPNEWGFATSASLTVASVDYLSRSGTVETWGPLCASASATSPLYAQRVRLIARDPDAEFTAELEVIKSVDP